MTDLLEEIGKRERERLASKTKSLYARTGPIASDIDPDGCLRRQVLEITNWNDKPGFDAHTQARFEVGNLHETEAIVRLKRAGFEVIEEQVPFELRRRGTSGEIVLRGKLDGKIKWEGSKIPFEVKTMHPNVFASVNSIEDLRRYWWTVKYISQLQAYLVGYAEAQWGFFMLTDCLGHWKLLRMALDLEEAERIWTYAETILDALVVTRRGGPLPPFSKRPTDCAHCDFFGRTCQPDLIEQGAQFMSDPDLISALDRRDKLRGPAKEYEALDGKVKAAIKAAKVTTAIAGDFMIEVSTSATPGHTVKPGTRTVVTIERVGQGGEP